jgi:hypothetical protein
MGISNVWIGTGFGHTRHSVGPVFSRVA